MRKFVQKRVLNFLQTKFGIAILVIGSFVLLNSLLAIFHHFLPDPNVWTASLPISLSSSKSGPYSIDAAGPRVSSSYSTDNLAGRSFEEELGTGPIDVVYTWVNGSDPRHQDELAFWKDALKVDTAASTAMNATIGLNAGALNASDSNVTHSRGDDHISPNRFRDNQELRYSLRSIWKFAPWVRHVWIVTNGQVPHWLNLDHPRLSVIAHSDIFPNTSHLPTFSSPAIESHLHRIPGLADRFIYFNDDVMLGNTIWPDDFVTRSAGYKVFLSWNIPNCAPGCPDTWISDKYCDAACNNAECGWDGGDCKNGTDTRFHTWDSSRPSAALSSGPKYCSSGCPNNWVGDKVCDRSCKNADCAFDGGDCGMELIVEHLPGYELKSDTVEFEVPFETRGLYFNLSTLFPGSILDAGHDNPAIVRSAIVTQHLHLLTFILFGENDISSEDAAAAAAAKNETTVGAPPVLDLPPRRLEVFLQGERDGVVGNFTFVIQRPRNPPPPPPKPEKSETGTAAAAEGKTSGSSEADDLQDSINAAQSVRNSQASPNAEPDGERHLLSLRSLGEAVTNLVKPTKLVVPEAIAATGAAAPSDPVQSLTTELTNLYDSRRSSWREMHEVAVDGVPTSPTPNSGIKLRDGAAASIEGGAEHSEVPIYTRRGDSIQLVETYGWDSDDYQFAQNIETAKKKELWLLKENEGKSAMLKALEQHRRADGRIGTVWPWELKLSNSNPELWEYLWHIVDEENKKIAAAQAAEQEKERRELEMDELALAIDSEASHHTNPLFQNAAHLMADDESDDQIFLHLPGDVAALNSTIRTARHPILNPHKRKLMDTFGDSLRFVNGLYSKEYGRETRKAPAHMPHFLDKHILAELQAKWPQEFEGTSSHRFRHSKDMQFSFSYFYYIVHERKPFDLHQLFTETLDLDGDGVLDTLEIRYMALFISGKKVKEADVLELESALRNVSLAMYKTGEIDEEVIAATSDLLTALADRVSHQKKFRSELVSLDQVEFYMVPDNTSKVQTRLDEIRAKMPKFVCLNDDMNKTHDPPPGTLKALRDFYHSYFPRASPFENPDHAPNDFQYVWEWRKKKYFRSIQWVLLIVLCGFGACGLAFLWLPLQWRKAIQSKFHSLFREQPHHSRLSSIV